MYAGFLLGGVIGGLLALIKIVERKGFPFGPFMLLGAVVGLLWGDALVVGSRERLTRPGGTTLHGRLTACCAG